MGKIRVEVREGPYCLFWFRLTPLSQLPEGIGAALKKIDSRVDSVWFPAHYAILPHKGKCLRCKKKTVLFDSDLCKSCFMNVSRMLQSKGLLVVPSNVLLDSLTRWQRFWLKMGRGKVWVLGGVMFGIAPGKELQFEEALRLMKEEWQNI